jgi:hypothetical protein
MTCRKGTNSKSRDAAATLKRNAQTFFFILNRSSVVGSDIVQVHRLTLVTFRSNVMIPSSWVTELLSGRHWIEVEFSIQTGRRWRITFVRNVCQPTNLLSVQTWQNYSVDYIGLTVWYFKVNNFETQFTPNKKNFRLRLGYSREIKDT